MADGKSGPNGPHPREEEAKEQLGGSTTSQAEPLVDDDGSGPNGPHFAAAALEGDDGSGPNGPHFKKAKSAAAGADGGAMALEDDGSEPNGPH